MKVRIHDTPAEINEINSTIKPIEREESNAELEKNEVVFNPVKMTLHNVLGKRHSQGGTTVKLDKGSFIISDYKKLAINKKDAEEMEFKTHGTPAKVLKREVNLKDHNRLIDMLINKKGDEISNNSAQLMIEKNLNKLGQVAFKQEEKKRFPEGVPDLSKGTAPIYSVETKNNMEKSKQYQIGGSYYSPHYKFTPRTSPFKVKPAGYNDPKYISSLMQKLNEITGNNYNTTQPGLIDMRDSQWNSENKEFVEDAQKRGYTNINATKDFNYVDKARPFYDAIGVVKNPYDFTQEQKEIFGKEKGVTYLDEQKSKGFWIDPITGRYIGARFNPQGGLIKKVTNVPIIETPTGAQPKIVEKPVSFNGTPENPDKESLPLIADYPNMGLTDYQKLSLGRQALNVAGIKRLDPYRLHQESVITKNKLFSAQPYLNQIGQGYNSALKTLRGLTNFSQLNAAASEIRGNTLDQNNKAIDQVEQNNVSLQNSEQANNANTYNSDAQKNREYDSNYYDKTIVAKENFDNLKDIAKNKFYENLDQTLYDNQAMNNIIHSQRLIGTDIPVRGKDGEIIGYKAQLPILPKKGFYGWGTQANTRITPEALLNYNKGAAQSGNQIQQSIVRALEETENTLANETDPKLLALARRDRTSLLALLNKKQ